MHRARRGAGSQGPAEDVLRRHFTRGFAVRPRLPDARHFQPHLPGDPRDIKALIVVVNGQAVGAGSELVTFGDLVIATPNAKFLQPEVKMGVFPPFAAIMLPALIGPKKTYELILTGQALSAEE